MNLNIYIYICKNIINKKEKKIVYFQIIILYSSTEHSSDKRNEIMCIILFSIINENKFNFDFNNKKINSPKIKYTWHFICWWFATNL